MTLFWVLQLRLESRDLDEISSATRGQRQVDLFSTQPWGVKTFLSVSVRLQVCSRLSDVVRRLCYELFLKFGWQQFDKNRWITCGSNTPHLILRAYSKRSQLMDKIKHHNQVQVGQFCYGIWLEQYSIIKVSSLANRLIPLHKRLATSVQL